LKRRWQLAVSVTAPTVSTDFPGSQLMPSLGEIQDHPVLVDGLEGKRLVRGYFHEEAGVRISIGFNRLLVTVQFSHWNFAQAAQALQGVAGKQRTSFTPAVHVGRGLLSNYADRMDLAVVVRAGIRPLQDPVPETPLLSAPLGGNASRWYLAIRS